MVAHGEGAARSSPLAGDGRASSPLSSPSTSSVDPFDRAAGGDDVAFGATGDSAASRRRPSPGHAAPTTTPRRRVPRSVVVVGDSQAHALAINLPDGIDDTFDVTDGSVDGCSVYDEGTLQDRARRLHTCRSAAATAGRTSGPTPPTDADAEVALVVLGAWDVFDFELDDGTDLEFGTPEWDDVRHRQTCSRASTRSPPPGARVALLEVPCMRPQDVEGAGVPALPERGDDDRVAHVNDLWRQRRRRQSRTP